MHSDWARGAAGASGDVQLQTRPCIHGSNWSIWEYRVGEGGGVKNLVLGKSHEVCIIDYVP